MCPAVIRVKNVNIAEINWSDLFINYQLAKEKKFKIYCFKSIHLLQWKEPPLMNLNLLGWIDR